MPFYITDIADATKPLREADRILVIGCSGSGKSTLSRQLSDVLDIPHLSMDREFFWLPGWQERPREEIDYLVERAVQSDRWLIDGTGMKTLAVRLKRARLVIWLHPPRIVSLYGVVKRWIRYIGRSRPDMADGCPERLDRDFLRYIWHFEEREVPQIISQIDHFAPDIPVLVLKSHKDMNALVGRLAASATKTPLLS